MTKIPDIIIIGGGIIGLMTAREFFLAGADVAIIEKNQLGQESSWAGGGILLPLYPWRQPDAISRLALQSLKLYPTLAEQLKNESLVDPEWHPCGMLITKNPDFEAARTWCETNRISYHSADNDFFKQLNTDPQQPLWLPGIAQARNPRLVKSLKQYLLNKGIVFIEQCELQDLTLNGNRINSIKTSSGRFDVNQLIISAGAWTGELYRKLFPSIPQHAPNVAPVKGQMILFDAEPGLLPYIVLDDDQYLIPRLDGKIIAGSTVERRGFNKSPSSQANVQLTEFALNLMPALNNYPVVNHWAGLRPGTDQGIPYIAKHPEIDNLSINAGHFRNGLVMGPASAQLMVDLVLRRPTSVAPEPYTFASAH
jgi:glycine oxidase